jgi:succinate dehydrogenase / fumarate reductase, cytochrome b subunit
MSATAADLHSYRVVGFWQSTNGKKVVMALTGVMMFLFVIGHLLGNLLVFAGRAQINAYAQFLHFDDSLLWIVRTILIIAATMHVVVTIQLALRNKEARPIGYLHKKAINSSYASRTMYWSGPIILTFIIFHLLQFTAGYIHPETKFIPNDVYHNLVTGFRVWWVSAWYVFAICLLGLHLRHGLWSMLQSIGLAHSLRKERAFKRVALGISILIVGVYISIPISILLGYLK